MGKRIGALKMMLSGASNPKEIVALYCKENQLDEEDIAVLREWIDKEIFSSSKKLTKKLVEENPELFDESIWNSSTEKSIDFILDDNYTLSDEDVLVALKTSNSEELTPEIASKVFERHNEALTQVLLRKINIDENFLVANVNNLTSNIFKNLRVKEFLNTKLIEELIENRSQLDMKFFVAALNTTRDFGWIKRMLKTPRTNYIQTANTFDAELLNLLNGLPELYFNDLFSIISTYDKNALSYTVLCKLLSMTDLSEEFCIENFDLFQSVGLRGALATYAVDHDFEALITMYALK